MCTTRSGRGWAASSPCRRRWSRSWAGKPGHTSSWPSGGGEVFGKLKLCEEATALPVVTGTKGGSFVVRLGRWAQLPEREVDRIAVEHQVEGRSLILSLPQHALNVAPARAAAVEPGPRPAAAKVDIVERVVGRNGARPVALQAGTRGGR